VRQAEVTGTVMIVGALVLGAIVAFGLYRWDTSARAAEASLRPPPVAPLAQTPLTPSPPAPAPAAPVASPPASTAGGDAAAGQQVFAAKCNSCHPNTNAGIGPAVHGAQFAQRYPDDGPLMLLIREGKGGMPPFPASQLSDQDLTNVVAYMRSLGTAEVTPEPTPTRRPRQ
jgi:mono/diheme cytochrome c family protein